MEKGAEKEMKKVCERLRMVERTRLMCNTQEELGEMVGCALTSGNGLVRKGGNSLFMKDAIFRELVYVARERMCLEVDLEEVVEVYEEVDGLIGKYGSRMKGMDVCGQMIQFFYVDGNVSESLRWLAEKMERRHVPVLILMLMGVLPRLSAKDGDVKPERIREDYRCVFAFLHELVDSNKVLRTLPALSEEEEKVKDDASVMCRLHLIYMMKKVLEAYEEVASSEGVNMTNRTIAECQFFPDVEGIWTENDDSTVFWKVERMGNVHAFSRYVLNDGEKKLVYERYVMKFYDMGENVVMLVVHPRAIEFILKGEQLPGDCYAHVDCTLKRESLEFLPLLKIFEWFRWGKLHRSSHADYFEQLLADKRYEQVNRFAAYEYDFRLNLTAVTAEYIYIETADGICYKVPKSLNDVLEDVRFGDNVGVVTYAGSTYIAFDDKNLYYDVTTEEKMERWGIVKEEFFRKDGCLIVKPLEWNQRQ